MPAANPENRHPLLHDTTWLHTKYIDEELHISQIGEIVGHADETVIAALRDADVPVRPRGGNHHIRYPQLRDPEWMTYQLVDMRRTLAEVARRLNCGETTVRRAVKRPEIAQALEQGNWDPQANAAEAQYGLAANYIT